MVNNDNSIEHAKKESGKLTIVSKGSKTLLLSNGGISPLSKWPSDVPGLNKCDKGHRKKSLFSFFFLCSSRPGDE